MQKHEKAFVGRESNRRPLAGAAEAAVAERRSQLVALLDRNDRELIFRRRLRAHQPGRFEYLEAHGRFKDD